MKKVSPAKIRPIPKVNLDKISIQKRKGQRAEVLTSSPIKKLQYDKMKKAETKMVKVLPKRQVKKEQKKNPTKIKTKIVLTVPFVQRYVKGPDGKPVEDWIQCFICEKWYHEDCTAYVGKAQFVCDFCEDDD